MFLKLRGFKKDDNNNNNGINLFGYALLSDIRLTDCLRKINENVK